MTNRVALVAWELGGGRGHLEHLRPVVEALLRAGWTVLAAVRDLAGGHAVLGSIDAALRGRRFAIGQAPIFLHRATRPRVRPSALAEVLAHSGFADPVLLRPVVETWERLIQAVKPGVIVADFSPSVVAAARGRIPVVMTGNGWTIPPAGAPAPSLPIGPREPAAAADAEARICTAFAEVSQGSWRPPTFGHLLRADRRFIYTFPMLDPYRALRRDPLFWPPNLVLPAAERSPGDRGAALLYLPRGHAAIPYALAALARLDIPTTAYFGGALPDAPRNVTVSPEPLPFADLLPIAPVVVHHGGLGVASWCVASRRPQAILPLDLEKSLIGHAVHAAGGGVALSRVDDPQTIVQAVDRASRLTPGAMSSIGMADLGPEETLAAVVAACKDMVAS